MGFRVVLYKTGDNMTLFQNLVIFAFLD